MHVGVVREPPLPLLMPIEELLASCAAKVGAVREPPLHALQRPHNTLES